MTKIELKALNPNAHQTVLAVAHLFNSTANPNAKLYAGGGHEDRFGCNAAKVRDWGERDVRGSLMKCLIAFDAIVDAPLGMVSLSASLIRYNGKPIHEGGILFMASNDLDTNVAIVRKAVCGYYGELVRQCKMESAGWICTVGLDNSSVSDALKEAGMKQIDTKSGECKSLLDFIYYADKKSRFTKDEAGNIFEDGVERLVFFYNPMDEVSATGVANEGDV